MNYLYWLGAIIPLILTGFFIKKVNDIRGGLIATPSLLMLWGFYLGFTYYSKDIEYHGGWITSVTWEESWTEQVTTYSTDDKGNITTSTTYVYHPDHYYLKDSNGYLVGIYSKQYAELAQLFGGSTKIDDGHGGQSSFGDGRTFRADYPNTPMAFTPCFTSHRYENRIITSSSIFNFEKVDLKLTPVYDYPLIFDNYKQNSLVGLDDPDMENVLTLFNSRNGAEHKIRLFVVVFNDQPSSIGRAQQAYWQGGNKNEVVVCVGLKAGVIDWVYPFGWGNEKLMVDLREEISEYSALDEMTINAIIKLVSDSYTKIDWHQFDYLPVYFPWWVYPIGWSLSILTWFITYGVLTDFDDIRRILRRVKNS